MVAFGYTLMTEQRGPRDLVADAVAAENAGFDFEVSSDHYFPWLVSQGHAPNAWAVLGAVATATQRVPLMTYVTCPTVRYHPAVVAQQAATVALLAGDYVNRVGRHFRVDSARLWDVPDGGVPVAVAVSGQQSVEAFAPAADAMVAVEPLPELVRGFDEAAGVRLPKIGQQPISWGSDRDEAVARAHDQFRWFAGGWKVNAELPGPAAFAAASQFVRPEDIAEAFACGPDVAAHVEAVRPFVDAGFTHVALVPVGGDTQPEFLRFAADELLPALREEYGKSDDARIAVR